MDDLNTLSDLAMWSLLIGAILPVLVSVIKRSKWSKTTKALLALLIFTVAGTGTAYFNDQFNGRTIVSCILLVAVTAYTLFQNFYKPTGLDEAITNATERTPPSHNID